jgi:predicted amidohydrolase
MNSLTVTLIQTSLRWENKTENLAMLEEKITGISEKTEVVILPEMFSTGFTMNAAHLAETMDGATMEWMKKISAKKKCIVTGSIIIKENDRFFNRLIWMLPNGEFGFYDKRHLFAMADENTFYTSGNKRFVASVNGWKIHLQICYDLRFPVWARQSFTTKEPEYDVLINVANWGVKRNNAWKTLLQARALENQCYAIGVNRVGIDENNVAYNGDSMIVDPMGNILYHKEKTEDVFTITLQKETIEDARTKFPFLKDGDLFKIF